uniref:5'-(N(7)-methylguanosine 5'-triphospho)-[mRNA] hydrolase n=1 Tax=Suricata suricatta TaxID=37032 RepID=A0A673V8R2_SURSU
MAAMAAEGLVGKGRDISLAALQRHDPYINRIVDVASQVALYTFGHRANEWEKTDVEGTLFVYTRSASPKHGFTIMNRLSMENRTEPITKDLDFQLQDPFLLYRNARYCPLNNEPSFTQEWFLRLCLPHDLCNQESSQYGVGISLWSRCVTGCIWTFHQAELI